MSRTLELTSHLIVIPFETWGLARPLLHLCIRLLTLHPSLHITQLLSPEVALLVTAELASPNFPQVKPNVYARLQRLEVSIRPYAPPLIDEIDAASDYQEQGNEADQLRGLDREVKSAAFAKAITGYFELLFDVEMVGSVRVKAYNKFRNIEPTCVIFDMLLTFVPDVLHELTSTMNLPDVSALAFVPCGPTAILNHFAKAEEGGFVSIMQKLIAEGVARGDDPLKTITAVGTGDTGALKILPGLPTMTDYEHHPGLGSCPVPPQLMLLCLKACENAWSPHQRGLVSVNVEEMEMEAKQKLEASMGKPFWSLGFQYSDEIWKGRILRPAADDYEGLQSIAFLDAMHRLHGPKTVIYISFGSTWFPHARPDLVHHLLDTLMSTKTPFLFAYSTEFVPVSTDLLEKVKNAEFGLTVRTAPQIQVLHHAATGFFVSHCGGSSMAEAIVARIPIVGMPFGADQGENCEILKKYNAAIDIKQVKCFFGDIGKPTDLYDGTRLVGTEEAIKAEMVDLWDQLKGDLGLLLYMGMDQLGQHCKKSCEKGGASRQAMLDFAKYF